MACSHRRGFGNGSQSSNGGGSRVLMQGGTSTSGWILMAISGRGH